MPRHGVPTRSQAVDAVIGRHDGRGIEAGRVHQPQPKLALGPAAAGTGKVRRQIALELLFGKWAAVAEDASAGTLDHQRAAARRVASRIRERFRNGVADDGVGPQRLRAGRAGQREQRGREQHPDMASSI